LDVFETDKNDNRKKVGLNTPLARLLRYSPNQYMTAQEFREAMTMQLCFYGNAYALIERNSVGDVMPLPLMSAIWMSGSKERRLSIAIGVMLNMRISIKRTFFTLKALI
jgi:phage portal protein BeeE